MIHEASTVVPPLVAATQATTPSAEPPSPGEITLPAPTAEQIQAADGVFADSTHPNAVATLFGVAASLVLLRDVAVDTFDTSGEEEEEELSEQADKDADATE